MDQGIVVIGLALSEVVSQKLQSRSVTPSLAFQGSTTYTIGRTFHSATRSFPLESISVRCIPISRVFTTPSPAVIPALVEHPNFDAGTPVREGADAADFFKRVPDPTPWFTEFLSDLDDALMFNPAQFIHEPFCCVCVVSEEEPNPIELFKELRKDVMSESYDYFQLSPDMQIPMKYVLLSDPVLGGAQAKPTFEAMQSVFHPSLCTILSLDLSTLSPNVPSPAVNSFVFDLLTLLVLPDLEFRIRALNTSISTIRKGFRNQLKSFFGARKPTSRPDSGYTPTTSIEIQTRQLADYAYIIGDIPLALEHYRMYANDCRSKDRLRIEYAHAETGVAICAAILSSSNQNRSGIGVTMPPPSISLRDIETSLDAAVHAYLSDSRYACAVRVACYAGLLARTLPALSRSAASLLLRIGSKDDTDLAAILLEQTAFAFLCARPPLYRQYALHMIRAGHLYQKLSHRMHAIRCYKQAFAVYQGRSWLHIEDHIRFKLGREFFNTGDYDASLSQYTSLVGGGRQRQDTLLKEFVIVAKRSGRIDQTFKLDIPRIIVEEFVIGDRLTLPDMIEESIWLQPQLYSRFDLSLCWTLCFWSQIVPTGTSISIRCRLQNPLAIPLELSRLRLNCTVDGSESHEGISVSEHDLSLDGSESQTIVLTVSCSVPGRFLIHGLCWTMLDVIRASSPLSESFNGISSATQLPRIKRWLQRGFRPSTLWRVPLPIIPELQFADFQPTLPLVTMQFEAFPDSLFFCEQRQVLLQITVTSDVAVPAQLHISDSRSINISEDLTKMMLPPGTSVYTAAVFGYTMGACKVRLLLRYSTGAKQSLEFRTTSTTETLNVMPSLQFSVAMRPSTEHTLNHTMEITASNISDSTYFDLGKIVLINGTGSRPYTLETIGLVTTGVERSSSTNLIARAVPQIRSDETISSEFMELSSRGHRLSCHWSCENGTRSGVSELPVDLSPASEASNCPFRITVDFADIAVHDFSANLLMFVPVTIAICNSSPKSLIFDFETLSPETVFDPETRQFQTVTTSCARGRYFWSGLTKKTGTKLDANGSISFQLDACFTHPGVYTLNRFRFMLQGDVPRLFFFPSRRTIRITQNASIQAPIKS